MTIQFFRKNLLQRKNHFLLVLLVEAEIAPGRLVGLEDPGAAALLVLVTVREDQALGRLAEEILEGIQRPRRAEPDELVRAQVDARLEMILVLFSYSGVDSIGNHDQV